MAHHTLQIGFPELPLVAGMKLKLAALSPTADSAITGVTVTRWAVYGYDRSIQQLPDDIFSVNPELVPDATETI